MISALDGDIAREVATEVTSVPYAKYAFRRPQPNVKAFKWGQVCNKFSPSVTILAFIPGNPDLNGLHSLPNCLLFHNDPSTAEENWTGFSLMGYF